MINQKDLEKTKFFTTTGSDIWKLKEVDTIMTAILVNCETGDSEEVILDEPEHKNSFLPVIMPKISPVNSRQQKTKKLNYKKQKIIDNKKQEKGDITSVHTSGHGIRKDKAPSSQYLGVRAVKGKKYTKYMAQINRGKFIHLGTFNIEEEAAAAVQEHLGNSEEATRLRVIARQKQQEKINSVKKMTAFMCTNCGAGYATQPQKCNHCGKGSFIKSRSENDIK